MEDFTVQQLTRFVNYLNSSKRRKAFAQHPTLGTEDLDGRLSVVHHADVENFKAQIGMQ